jgi:hypothetical protein
LCEASKHFLGILSAYKVSFCTLPDEVTGTFGQIAQV